MVSINIPQMFAIIIIILSFWLVLFLCFPILALRITKLKKILLLLCEIKSRRRENLPHIIMFTWVLYFCKIEIQMGEKLKMNWSMGTLTVMCCDQNSPKSVYSAFPYTQPLSCINISLKVLLFVC